LLLRHNYRLNAKNRVIMKITRHCLRALEDLVVNRIFQLANLDEVTLGKLNLDCPVSCSSECDCVSRQSWDHWASAWALNQGFVGRMSIPHKNRTDFEWKDVIHLTVFTFIDRNLLKIFNI